MLKRSISAAVVIIFVALAVLAVAQNWQKNDDAVDVLAFVVSDDVPLTDVSVRAWMDAALEEGLHLEPMHAQSFLRPSFLEQQRYAGIIIPDGIHRNMSQVTIDTLSSYVQQGGKLMVVFDAGTLTPQGGAMSDHSRLSGMVGVEYALYKELGDETLITGPAISTPNILTELRFPPGKYVSLPQQYTTSQLRDSRKTAGLDTRNEVLLSSYGYGSLEYGHFVTRGTLQGRTLMTSYSGDLLAGVHPFGNGQVLFVNLPLTYLKLRTDGAPLHGFLHYFGDTMLKLPMMGNAPGGIGGMIMNWHVDSKAAIKPMEQMADLGFFEQGPYSVHLTAGPDNNLEGDNAGMDVEHNPEIQKWIKAFDARGDEVGSHGGWMHNYFGKNVREENAKEFGPLITRNNNAIAKIMGHPVHEYSAPLGNHPIWMTELLEKNGVHAHYYTGNTGQGPTRAYINGNRLGQNTWTFPVSVRGSIATFEEAFMGAPVTQDEFGTWLNQLSDFTRDQSVIRLFYFHPPGVVFYRNASLMWMTHTKELLAQGKFRWYTMTRIAQFLDQRDLVNWTLSGDRNTGLLMTASHPQNLAEQSWRFPKSRYVKPVVEEGAATFRETADEWVLVAGTGKLLKARIKVI
jgi:hypothetical protein